MLASLGLSDTNSLPIQNLLQNYFCFESMSVNKHFVLEQSTSDESYLTKFFETLMFATTYVWDIQYNAVDCVTSLLTKLALLVLAITCIVFTVWLFYVQIRILFKTCLKKLEQTADAKKTFPPLFIIDELTMDSNSCNTENDLMNDCDCLSPLQIRRQSRFGSFSCYTNEKGELKPEALRN